MYEKRMQFKYELPEVTFDQIPQPEKPVEKLEEKNKVILLEDHTKCKGKKWLIDNIIKQKGVDNIYLEIPGDMKVGDYVLRADLETLNDNPNLRPVALQNAGLSGIEDGVLEMTLKDYLGKKICNVDNAFNRFITKPFESRFNKLNERLFGENGFELL